MFSNNAFVSNVAYDELRLNNIPYTVTLYRPLVLLLSQRRQPLLGLLTTNVYATTVAEIPSVLP